MITYTTADDVYDITGATVSNANVQQAAVIVEVMSGAAMSDEDYDLLDATDQRWITLAVAYQAAWIQDQPDVFSRIDVSSLNQDGVSMQTRDEFSLVLAPLAKRALNRTSWRRYSKQNTGVRTLSATAYRAGSIVTDPVVQDDEAQTWVGL